MPPLDHPIVQSLHHRRLQLVDLPVLSTKQSQMSMLITSNPYWQVATGDVYCLDNSPTAVGKSFGWVVQGSYTSSPLVSNATSILFLTCEHANPTDNTTMRSLESIGITEKPTNNTDDHPAIKSFTGYIIKQGKHYEVSPMIKKPGIGTMNTNHILARMQLLSQLQSLRQHPELLQEYHFTITEFFNKGHAERVPLHQESSANIYCLPHHAVVCKEFVTT